MERYYAKIMCRDGAIRRWSVLDNSYNGVATEVTLTGNGITIAEDNDEAAFAPVRSWTGTVSVLDEGNLSDLLAKNAHHLRSIIRREDNGEVEWAGYVTPDVRTQNYPTLHSEVQIPIRGRLKTADGYYIERKETQTFVTLASLLHEALLLCGFADTDEMWWPQTYTMPKDTSGLRVLAMKISRARFLKPESEKETVAESGGQIYPESAAVVISEIMKLFGYTLYERNGKLQAVGMGKPTATQPMETSYSVLTLGALGKIDEQSNVSGYLVDSAEIDFLSTLETSEQYVSMCQGAKSVKVEVEMSRGTAESLPGTDVLQFPYLGSYVRQIVKESSTYTRLRTLLFGDRSENIRTFVYYRQSTQPDKPWFEDDVRSWLNSKGKLDDSLQGSEASRPGMVPARLAQYMQHDMEGGKLKNYEFVDGYLFNPGITEAGTKQPQITSEYPLLKIRSGKEVSYHGGAIVISFDIVGDSYLSLSKLRTPLDFGVKVFALLKIGNNYWNGSSWIRSAEMVELPLENRGLTIFDKPASSVKDGKTIEMPYNGHAGYFAELRDSAGNALELQGEMQVTFYIEATQLSGAAATNPYKYLFLTNLHIDYVMADDDMLRMTTGVKSSDRVITKRTTAGFDAEAVRMTLKMGSYAYDSGAALSTLTFGGRHIDKVKRNDDGKELPPEEFLLSNLLQHYDRIVERREITVRQGTVGNAVNIIQTEEGRRWRQIALSQNYGEGEEHVTIENV